MAKGWMYAVEEEVRDMMELGHSSWGCSVAVRGGEGDRDGASRQTKG